MVDDDGDLHDGQMTHDRSTNGGMCSFDMYEWVLDSVLNFNSEKIIDYTVIELGCGPGIFSIVASALFYLDVFKPYMESSYADGL